MNTEVSSFIDKNEKLIIDLETGLSARPAISPEIGGEGEIDKAQFLEDWLKKQGISIKHYDAPDKRAKGGIRPNLVAIIKGKETGPGKFWLIGHIDVVPPGEAKLWDSDPYKVIVKDSPKGKMLLGRGVEDNQQGIVSITMAALALKSAGLQPKHDVALCYAADEECGSSYGVQYLIKEHPELFSKDDTALIPDGGDSKGESIEIAEKTGLKLKITTIGKQAHAASPQTGRNAFVAGSDLVVRLNQGLPAKFSVRNELFQPPYSTFAPTKKEANVPNINTIPGEDVFYIDCRILPETNIDDVIEEAKRIAKGLESDYGVKVNIEGHSDGATKPTSKDTPLVAHLSRAVKEVYSVDTRCVGIGGGTVGAFLRNIGIPSLVWARQGGAAHQPNEFALLDSIKGDAKVMAQLMLEV